MALLETKRLIVRKFTLADASFLLKLLNDPGYINHIADRGVRTMAQSTAYLQNKIFPSFESHGYGLYLIETKDKKPIGTSGILKREELDLPDIGFAFLESATGKGYAFESTNAIIEHFSSQHGLNSFYGITSSTNLASQKLLLKLGFNFSHAFDYRGQKNTFLYSMTV